MIPRYLTINCGNFLCLICFFRLPCLLYIFVINEFNNFFFLLDNKDFVETVERINESLRRDEEERKDVASAAGLLKELSVRGCNVGEPLMESEEDAAEEEKPVG